MCFANHPGEMVLTCADVCANSGPSSEEMFHFGPMGHVSVPFRHAPGGAVVFQKNRDAVPICKVVVLRSLGKIVNRASWGCRTVSDLRLWTCTLRRTRRLRSLLSRFIAAGRPRFPHRCAPKSGAGSDGRFTAGAQGCGFLRGAPGRKAALRDVHDGCGRCSPGFWLLTDRLLLPCS